MSELVRLEGNHTAQRAHCALCSFFDRIPLIWTFEQLNIIWTFEHLNIWTFEELNICLMLTKSSPESGLDYIPPSQAIPLQVDHFVCISIFSRENKFVLYWMLFFMHLFNVLKNVQEQNGTNGKASNGNGCPARDPYEDLVRMFTRA